VGFYFFPKILFLSHYFGTRNARKPIKPSNDSVYSLVSKIIFRQKVARWIGVHGPVISAKNA